MFLQRLELQGFKSFADKTVFDFNHGIVAIVGPNGSGKSNVTDSVRWLLGEREATNLRGAKVEDLIFAGTERRPRLGLAQATLYFDNSSGFFPVEFKEVSVSRKVGRDETSEFYLNKVEVRLKDIIDFFAKSRLGARGLNVISQGESDIFIKATPEERREMIEEILGLKEYQIKKADAKRRLKNTFINLDKAKALIEEIRPHLRFLRKQVSRYEGREETAARLKELEDTFYGSRFAAIKKESSNIENNLLSIDRQITSVESELKKLEEEFERVKKSEPKANDKLKEMKSERTALMSHKSEIEREVGRLEARLELSLSKSDLPPAELVKALKEIQKIALQIQESDVESLKRGVKEILTLTESVFKESREDNNEELKERSAFLLQELKKIDSQIEALSQAEGDFEANLGKFNQEFQAAFLSMENKKDELGKLLDQKNHLSFQRERLDLKTKDLDFELGEIGRRKDEFLSWQGEASGDEESTRKQMFRLRGMLLSIGEVDENLVKEAKETEERYAFLVGQLADLERAITDLKTLIKELDYKIHHEFDNAIKTINEEFTKFIRTMFGGGRARLILEKIEAPKPVNDIQNGEAKGEEQVKPVESGEEEAPEPGIEIELTLPKKRIKGLEVLSGGERSLVSTAALFALISVSPPPFLVLDEIDAALDERNARRFGELLKDFAKKTQFVIITHNRATMEAADVLYGVTMGEDGTSQVLSLKLQSA